MEHIKNARIMHHRDLKEVGESKILTFMCTDSAMNLDRFSLEILVKIMSFMTLKEILLLETIGKRFSTATTIHLRTRKTIDFTEGKWYGEMSPLITDGIFSRLLKRCPEVENVLGIHTRTIGKRQQRHVDALSVDGITAALTFCHKLKSINTSNVQVLDAMLALNPSLEISGGFRNRGGEFPISPQNCLTIPRKVKLSQLVLTGVTLPSLPEMDTLSFLQLRWVKFTDPEPFRDFSSPKLEHFIMKNCMSDSGTGSYTPLTCLPLLQALGKAAHLERLELVRVPFPGGVFRHVVEDNWRLGSFRYLSRVSLASCSSAIEVDLGYLVLVSAFRLEELSIQPSLTKDAVFSALLMARAEYPRFECLQLGYADDFPEKGRYTDEELLNFGLPLTREQSASLSDRGMNLALQVFPQVRYMSVCNCPNLRAASLWPTLNLTCIALRDLTVCRCKNVCLKYFSEFLSQLPNIEYVHLEDMFKGNNNSGLQDSSASEKEGNELTTLFISSHSLKSLSLRKCGITKLSIVNCPSLCYLSCTAFKKLSRVEFKECLLNRTYFSLCPALSMKSVLDEVCKLPASTSRFVSLRPTELFDPVKLEHQLFTLPLDYHVCIMHDQGNPAGISTKVSIYSWMDAITAINKELIDNLGFQHASHGVEHPQKYPWDRDIYRFHGERTNGHFEFVTDFPWLRRLSYNNKSCLSQSYGSVKSGQLPRLKNNLPMNVCLEILNQDILEKISTNYRLHKQVLVLYLNTVDVTQVYDQDT